MCVVPKCSGLLFTVFSLLGPFNRSVDFSPNGRASVGRTLVQGKLLAWQAEHCELGSWILQGVWAQLPFWVSAND